MSFTGLGIGVLILLTSLQMFININELMKNNSTRKNGFDFLSVTKVITNDNMGKDNTFSNEELSALRREKEVDEVGPLISNQFRVKANAGNIVPFSTDLFLESIPSDFLDSIPLSFKWAPGDEVIPIIFSSDFLEMYNVFAPSQGLPQLSDKTISSVVIGLECSGNGKVQNFKANIVGLSDRINSILVPENFMNWANENLGNTKTIRPERIYIKTKDANNPEFINYIDQHHFRINKDKTKFGRTKSILENIITGLAIFGILVIVLALMLFSFYLQLVIAKSKENLSLLVTLGYSPNWISKMVAKTWIPTYAIVIFAAMIVTSFFNFLFINQLLINKSALSLWLNWSVILLGFILLFLSIISNYNMVRKKLVNLSS